MIDRCPNCRARLDETEQCRRCGLELMGLRAVVDAAELHLIGAVRCLVDGDHRGAALALEQALTLTGDPLAAALLGFARAHLDPPADPGSDSPPTTGSSAAEWGATRPEALDDRSSSVGGAGD